MTPSGPTTHHRHSIRLKGYDYTRPGAYFVTMVAFQRLCMFGEVVGETVRLNTAGRIVYAEWQRLERVFANIELGAFVVMPNHVHGIIVINGDAAGDSVGALEEATRPGPHGIDDGEDREPDESWVGDGVGATRLGPNRYWDGEDRVPDESRVRMDGSPLQVERLPDETQGGMDGIGATRLGLNRYWDGEDRVPDGSQVGMDGHLFQQIQSNSSR